jgi:predicted HTH domain antitoxin
MNHQTTFQEIASQVQLFQSIEQKETFIFVLGALTSRLISLHKAAEIMEMDTEIFLKVLELMGIDFSYLTVEDIAIEKICKHDENSI